MEWIFCLSLSVSFLHGMYLPCSDFSRWEEERNSFPAQGISIYHNGGGINNESARTCVYVVGTERHVGKCARELLVIVVR